MFPHDAKIAPLWNRAPQSRRYFPHHTIDCGLLQGGTNRSVSRRDICGREYAERRIITTWQQRSPGWSGAWPALESNGRYRWCVSCTPCSSSFL